MRLSSKIYAIVFAAFLLISASFIINDYFSQLKIKEQDSLRHLHGIATTIGAELDVISLENVLNRYTTKNAIRSNNQDTSYYKVHTQMKHAQDLNKLERSIHTLSKSEGNRFFYGVSSAEKPYYWQAYADYPQELLENYEQGGIIPIYEGPLGKQLSAFFPVKNQEGKTLAVVLVSRTYEDFKTEAQAELRKELLFSFICMMVIAIAAFVLLKRTLDSFEEQTKNLTEKANYHESQYQVQEQRIGKLVKETDALQDALDSGKVEYKLLASKLDKQDEKLTGIQLALKEKDQRLRVIMQYSKGIQQILIPKTDLFSKVFSDAFVLFKPKEQVSGDFYFCTEVNNKTFVAVVDCTGEGVPGAFMNLLAHNFFHQIIEVSKVLEPNLILDEMHGFVTKLLQQETSNFRDGMDIALCVIDENQKQIEFSGAQRPLIYIKENELVTIKGDAFSVGGRHRFQQEKFTKITIDIQSGMEFYLFSDGLQDQVGYAFDVIETRKFGKKRMEQLFNEVHRKPMHEQKKLIDERFNDWRKDEDQVDDILIVGFRFD